MAVCGEGWASVVTVEGNVFSWGRGESGQLGLGGHENHHVPAHAGGHKVMVSLAAGHTHAACVALDGSAWTWGTGASRFWVSGFKQKRLGKEEKRRGEKKRTSTTSLGSFTPPTDRKAAQEWELASTDMISGEADAAVWVEAPGRRRIVRQGRIRGSMPGYRGLSHPRSTHCGPTYSKGLMTVSSNWVGVGKDLLLRDFPDGDIFARNIKFLHQRVDLGLFTIFIKQSELIGESFSTRRLADGPTKGETILAMYDGTALVHIPPSYGRRWESSTDAQ